MEFFQGVVVGVRNIKGEFDLNPGMQVDVIAKVDDEHIEFLEQNKEVISQLARIKQFEISKEPHIPKGCASFVCEGCEFYVPLEGVIDFQKELERLVKK